MAASSDGVRHDGPGNFQVKPVLALVGRPNVGKSTLFNRLTKSRDAIVADFAGLTRDRHYGNGRQGRQEFIVIDTGGFEPDASNGIYKEMAKQTQQAVAEADVVIFVVDARGGLSAQDHDIAKYLRKIGKPCLLVANKAEGMREGIQLTEFYELGLGEVIAISAAHGQGTRGLLDLAFQSLHLPDEPEETEDDPSVIKLAVAGRPNVGKSTLINTWLGEERLVAFDMPGTTRDAISVPFEREGQKFELIDTAGLRRKGKVFEAIEKFSVVKTLQAIESAHVVLLLLDAEQGVTDQDAHIAGYALESGRAMVLLEAVQFQSPQRGGMFRPKLRYAHQGGMNPPVIVIHGNSLEHVTDTYKRFLEGRFRKAFNLSGTPLRIEMKTSANPYADKESS